MHLRLFARSVRPALLFALLLPAPLVAQSSAGSGGGPGGATAARTGIALENLDRSVRPQDDFFRFVNGRWLDRTTIPADRSNYGAFTELADRAEQSLHRIVEDLATRGTAGDAGDDERKIGALYRSFMDTARIERLGLDPLRPDLERVAALRRHDQLPETFGWLTTIGVSRPFSAYVSQDARASDRYTVYLSQSGLGLPDRDYYFRDGAEFERTRGEYVAYIHRLLELAGHEQPAAAAERVMALESRIAEHHWTRVKNRDRDLTYNRHTLDELRTLAPGFAWGEYLRHAGIDTDAVVVRQPDYLTAAAGLIESTPMATWRDYLTFRLLDDAAPLLSSDFREARFDFRGRVLAGLEQERTRWKQGIDVVSSALGDALGRAYVERNFSADSRRRMEELVANLTEAFRQGIDRLEWMSPQTRAEAHAKLERFSTKIGYPDEWTDYAALEVDAQDLLGNMRRSARVEHRRRVSRLGQPVDRDEWFMNPYTVNAYYSSTMNEIVFPAAILQPPFFDPAADDAVNYGAIGAVIGHEISHGFDDQGRKSDGEGNLRDWWTEADAGAFEERADVLVAQYDAYNPIGDLHVNGRLTLGENIGDLSGLSVAHEAYRLSLDGQEPPSLTGFTGDQRFFIGWAQIWRRLYRDEELRNRLLTDSHSPSEYRVNGVVRNMDAFHRAFGVGPADAMWLAPERRVEIW